MTSCISVSRQWPLLPIFSDYSASVEIKPSSSHQLAQLQHVGLLKQRPLLKEEVDQKCLQLDKIQRIRGLHSSPRQDTKALKVVILL